MSTPETVHDQIERVEQMAVDSDDMWDLSLNDQAALRTVLQQRGELLAAGIQIRNVLGRLVMAVIMGHKIGEEMEAAVNKAQDAMNAAIARAEGKGQAA